MNKHKTIFSGIALALILSLLLAFAPLLPEESTAYAAADTYAEEGATSFVFSDSGITDTEGSYTGYKIEGTALTINEAGTYIVSGKCSDGSIKIKKGTKDVTLVLNGLTLTSEDTAPISCNKSTGVTIIAAKGTANSLTDSEENNDETYTTNTNAENAVIKCKDGSNVTIGGTGTINMTANGKNGIKSGASTDTEGEASLTIQNVTLNITANVNDGINAEQELDILSGNITISAADDAIHCDYVMNIGENGTSGPIITVKKSNEGLEAATLDICSGNINITSEDDGMNAANSDLTSYSFALNISGGSVHINTEKGDGIDSNGTITISGGTVKIFSASSGDNQPLDCDGTLSITGGTVLGVGASGMGTNISSGQAVVVFGTSGQQPGSTSVATIKAGSTIAIKDASGNTLYSATAVRNAGYVIFSSADLKAGSTYTLYVNSTSAGTAQAVTSLQGQGPGGQGQPNGQQPGQMQPNGQQPGQGQANGMQPPAQPQTQAGTTTDSSSSSASSSASSSSTTSTSSTDASSTASTDSTTALSQVKNIVSNMTLKAVSSKTAKGNIKVTANIDSDDIAAIKALGYTVKYKYYRSTSKASGYSLKTTKAAKTYLNTYGSSGTKYYYKVRVAVYDEGGNLVCQSALKQCRYACRTWTN